MAAHWTVEQSPTRLHVARKYSNVHPSIFPQLILNTKHLENRGNWVFPRIDFGDPSRPPQKSTKTNGTLLKGWKGWQVVQSSIKEFCRILKGGGGCGGFPLGTKRPPDTKLPVPSSKVGYKNPVRVLWKSILGKSPYFYML